MTRVLVVELLGGIGDLLLVLPAIHALARSQPQAEVTVLTFAPGDQLLAADPHVTRVITAERGEPGGAGGHRAAGARLWL